MLWVKAFHIISVITWFAALFYLPRLFVYHAMSEDKISIERFKIMERKLYYGIMMPSFIIATALGVILWQMNYAWALPNWLLVKLILVALLIAYHFYCGHLVKVFKQDKTLIHMYFIVGSMSFPYCCWCPLSSWLWLNLSDFSYQDTL